MKMCSIEFVCGEVERSVEFRERPDLHSVQVYLMCKLVLLTLITQRDSHLLRMNDVFLCNRDRVQSRGAFQNNENI